ncbi:Uncharacterised protein [uncultured archaeon]|nr:Uncharacterised protein [uncultured archaeon]
MARNLDEKELQILRKLAPELAEMEAQGIDIEYMNILPPVANHHSRDTSDFEQRLRKLSADDMRFLADLVIQGREALSCLHPAFAEILFSVAGQRLSSDVADQLREAYESGEECSR